MASYTWCSSRCPLLRLNFTLLAVIIHHCMLLCFWHNYATCVNLYLEMVTAWSRSKEESDESMQIEWPSQGDELLFRLLNKILKSLRVGGEGGGGGGGGGGGVATVAVRNTIHPVIHSYQWLGVKNQMSGAFFQPLAVLFELYNFRHDILQTVVDLFAAMKNLKILLLWCRCEFLKSDYLEGHSEKPQNPYIFMLCDSPVRNSCFQTKSNYMRLQPHVCKTWSPALSNLMFVKLGPTLPRHCHRPHTWKSYCYGAWVSEIWLYIYLEGHSEKTQNPTFMLCECLKSDCISQRSQWKTQKPYFYAVWVSKIWLYILKVTVKNPKTLLLCCVSV